MSTHRASSVPMAHFSSYEIFERMTTMDVRNMKNSAEELVSEDFKRQDSMNCDAHEGIELQRRIPHDTE